MSTLFLPERTARDNVLRRMLSQSEAGHKVQYVAVPKVTPPLWSCCLASGREMHCEAALSPKIWLYR